MEKTDLLIRTTLLLQQMQAKDVNSPSVEELCLLLENALPQERKNDIYKALLQDEQLYKQWLSLVEFHAEGLADNLVTTENSDGQVSQEPSNQKQPNQEQTKQKPPSELSENKSKPLGRWFNFYHSSAAKGWGGAVAASVLVCAVYFSQPKETVFSPVYEEIQPQLLDGDFPDARFRGKQKPVIELSQQQHADFMAGVIYALEKLNLTPEQLGLPAKNIVVSNTDKASHYFELGQLVALGQVQCLLGNNLSALEKPLKNVQSSLGKELPLLQNSRIDCATYQRLLSLW